MSVNEIVEYDLTTGQPRRIGHFAIEEELGSGAMGSVYRAKDESLGNLVAIKVIKPDLAQDKSARERFLREARAAATLRDHDHIVAVFSVNEIKLRDGRYLLYLVMPLLKGETLQDRIDRANGKALPIKEQLLIARQITEGLAAAHGVGLVHRDIKPGNIWLEARTDGTMRVKLLDFGLARSAGDSQLTATGATLGTPSFMAPEQGSNAGVDHRADLWSLGVIIFQMATGRLPFEGETPIEVMINARVNPLPSLPKLNPLLSKPHIHLIEQLLQKDRTERTQSASDVLTALQVVRNSYVKDRTEPIAPVLPPSPQPMSREKKVTIAAVVGAVMIGAVFAVWLVTRPGTKPIEVAETKTQPTIPQPVTTAEETKIEKKNVVPTKVQVTKEEKKVVPPVTKVEPKVVLKEPAILTCPADAAEVKRAQKEWATYLQVPVVTTEDLGEFIKLKLVLIPPGKFRMGSPPGESGRLADETAHDVTITKPFYLGAYEVSRGEFRKFMENAPYETEAEKNGAGSSYWDKATKMFVNDNTLNWQNVGHEQNDLHPVVQITWNDAQAFCKWMTQRKGGVRPGRKVCLPTEAEWEFACRAGTATRFYYGDGGDLLSDNGNTANKDDEYEYTAPTGRFLTNPFGLYDMHGNVWEWCDDWYGPFQSDAVKDPNLQEPPENGQRTLRGGCWNNIPIDARSAMRNKLPPDSRSNLLGFRVCVRLE